VTSWIGDDGFKIGLCNTPRGYNHEENCQWVEYNHDGGGGGLACSNTQIIYLLRVASNRSGDISRVLFRNLYSSRWPGYSNGHPKITVMDGGPTSHPKNQSLAWMVIIDYHSLVWWFRNFRSQPLIIRNSFVIIVAVRLEGITGRLLLAPEATSNHTLLILSS
jgi:hypothetical protein